MRALTKNKRPFWYSNSTGTTEELVDSNGYYTGEWGETYETPVKAKANISANRGNASEEPFGTLLDYDKVIVDCDPSYGINEKTRLWIDTPYEEGVPHDYIVKKIARSINGVSIAIKKVDVT